jgi:hypothetical protein
MFVTGFRIMTGSIFVNGHHIKNIDVTQYVVGAIPPAINSAAIRNRAQNEIGTTIGVVQTYIPDLEVWGC